MKKHFLISLVLLLVGTLTFTVLGSSKASALSGSDFKPGRIIDDAVFYDANSMSAAQIQNFLNSKVPVCDTNGDQTIYDSAHGDTVTRKVYAQRRGVSTPFICLKNYTQNTPYRDSVSGQCSALTAKTNRSAANIINDVAKACGVSPKVLLVLIQKESYGPLITDDWPWPFQYQTPTGYGCPDTAPCDSQYYGFFNQVYQAAKAFKRYAANPTSYNYRAGRNNTILWHPNTACGTSTVFIENQATANLYIYTPYRPNQAALDSYPGTGNSCSSYGNRNFWFKFNEWFGPTTGTTLFRFGNSDGVYMLGANNNYYHVPSRRILEAYGYPHSISYVKSVGTSYVSGRTLSGNLPIIARFQGDEVYLMDKGRAYHFDSPAILNTYGFSIGDEALLPESAKLYYSTAGTMETNLRSSSGPEVYHVENGKKRHIIDGEAYFSGSPAYSTRPEVTLSYDFIREMSNGAPVLTANKILKRTDTNTFVYWNGAKLQEIHNSTLSELQLNADYGTVASVINQLPSSGTSINKLVKTSDGTLYLLGRKKRFTISPSDLSELSLTTDDFTVVNSAFLDKVPNISVFRRIVRVDNTDPVYVIRSGRSDHFIDPKAILEEGFSLSDVVSIDPRSSSMFPNSGKKILSIGRLFRIDNSDPVFIVNSQNSSYHVPSVQLVRDLGYSMKGVLSLKSPHVQDYVSSGSLSNFVRDAEDNIWLIGTNINKHSVPPTELQASRYDVNIAALAVFPSTFFEKYSADKQLKQVIRVEGQDAVYKIENGTKRWITSATALHDQGFTFSDVVNVSDFFLASFASGQNIN